MMNAASIAYEHDYRVVHGIIDALYIQKQGITEADVRSMCEEIEAMTGIPLFFEGLFKWVVFLPSINDNERPVPTRYYGVFRSGEIKVRGIELRQRGVPRVVKAFQQSVLELMRVCNTQEEIISLLPDFLRMLRATIATLRTRTADDVLCVTRLSKVRYQHNIPQKQIVERLERRGVRLEPGQSIQFVHTTRGACLPSEYRGNIAVDVYQKKLVRALFVLVQPLGVRLEDIEDGIEPSRQTQLREAFAHS